VNQKAFTFVQSTEALAKVFNYWHLRQGYGVSMGPTGIDSRWNASV